MITFCPTLMKSSKKMALPKLVIFDLDYTLWPFYIDTHVQPPFTKNSSGDIVDQYSTFVDVYKEVPLVFQKVKEDGIQIAVASRTSEVEGAINLLKILEWDKFILYKEIYPGSKTSHFNSIRDKSGIAFSEMLFFDDEQRNIRDVSALGVTCVFVTNGVNMNVYNEGLRLFQKRKS